MHRVLANSRLARADALAPSCNLQLLRFVASNGAGRPSHSGSPLNSMSWCQSDAAWSPLARGIHTTHGSCASSGAGNSRSAGRGKPAGRGGSQKRGNDGKSQAGGAGAGQGGAGRAKNNSGGAGRGSASESGRGRGGKRAGGRNDGNSGPGGGRGRGRGRGGGQQGGGARNDRGKGPSGGRGRGNGQRPGASGRGRAQAAAAEEEATNSLLEALRARVSARQRSAPSQHAVEGDAASDHGATMPGGRGILSSIMADKPGSQQQAPEGGRATSSVGKLLAQSLARARQRGQDAAAAAASSPTTGHTDLNQTGLPDSGSSSSSSSSAAAAAGGGGGGRGMVSPTPRSTVDTSAFVRLREALSPTGGSARAAAARARVREAESRNAAATAASRAAQSAANGQALSAGDQPRGGGGGMFSESGEGYTGVNGSYSPASAFGSHASASAAAVAAGGAGSGPGGVHGGGVAGGVVDMAAIDDMLDYTKDSRRLAEEQIRLGQALAAYKPTAQGDKAAFAAKISKLNKTVKQLARAVKQQRGERVEAEGRPVSHKKARITISGPVQVPHLAKALSVPLATVLDHLEAVGEDLAKLSETAREHGESAVTIDADVAEFVVKELGGEVIRSDFQDRVPAERPTVEDMEELGFPRRVPVVTVMGHVDHGKTTLLDFLRRAAVADTEAGGITQGISAFCALVDGELTVDHSAKAKKGGATTKVKNSNNKQQTKSKKGKKGAVGGVESATVRAMKDPSGCLTFLDTPGHQLFSGMRQRGTAVTDAVVLVVAAEDGVMPQTAECVELLSKVPDVPVVVAVTKVDRLDEAETLNAIDSICEQLAGIGMMTEPLGGTVPVVGVSGVTGHGVEELKEHLILQCDVLELRADATALGEAAVLDSRLDRGLGYVADCVVQWGSLKVGDAVVVGGVRGRIKGLVDDAGGRHKDMPAGLPVRVVGLQEPPPAGELLMAVESEARAQEVCDKRQRVVQLAEAMERAREATARAMRFAEQRREERGREDRLKSLHRRAAQRRRLTAAGEPIPPQLEELDWEVELRAKLVEEAELEAQGIVIKKDSVMVARGQQQEIKDENDDGTPTLPIILRSDMRGSAEAIRAALDSFPQDHLQLRVVKDDVGSPSMADVEFARDTGSLIVAFNVGVPAEVQRKAEQEEIAMIRGKVIYSVLQAAADTIGPLLPPLEKEYIGGVAEVLSTFKITARRAKATLAAGCRVTDGVVQTNKVTRVMRSGEQVFEANTVTSLKRFAEDVNKVEKGLECGIAFEEFSDFELGDRIHCFDTKMEPQTLDISYLGTGFGSSSNETDERA